MNKLKKILLICSLLIGALGAGGYIFLRSSLAPLDGTLKIKNLSHSVSVIRDTFGVPHINAQNKLDALRALGFINASERLFQMEMARRLTYGELSEVFGEVALPSDKIYRSLMLKRSMERMLELEKKEGRFDEKMWNEMLAYCDGINQFIDAGKHPFELTVLKIQPRPFTPLDAFVLTGHMAYSFGTAFKADPLMSRLKQIVSPEKFQDLRNFPMPMPTQSAQSVIWKSLQNNSEDVYAASFEGSNAWLVAPSRSVSGKSLFANDPHIGFSYPSVWAEAHISTPEFELYGHYLPSVPFAILGHNRHHAWGFTVAMTDDMDLYREKIDRQSKTVLFENKPVPYQEWTETIKVKNHADVILQMIETPHGPLLDEVLEEKNISLKWAFHRPRNNPLKSLREMAEAKDINAFSQALQHGTAPGLNVMYADAENIAWWIFGDIAKRKNPHSDLIFDGASGADEYTGLLGWEEKPHSVNPASGIIVTANSRPEEYPLQIRGDWQSDDRYQTIAKALSEKDQWSSDDFKALQTENYNAQNKLLLEQLFENLNLQGADIAKYQDKVTALKQWNLHSEIDSLEAALFHQWNNENILLMLSAFDEETRTAYLNTPYAWIFYERAIKDPKSTWWSDSNKSDLITRGFKLAANKLKNSPTWGELHTIEFRHPLGRSFPLNKILNLGPYPIPGAYNEINNNKARALGGDFNVVAGPSTRRIIDFASPQKSWGINPIGVSGHKLSPFHQDQMVLFLQGKYRPQLMDAADIQAAKTHELILE